jgi:nickel-dependent lactate racemase
LQHAELMIVGSAIPDQTLRELLLTPVRTMEEALERAFAKLGPDASVWVLPYGVITIPVVKE